MSLEPGAKFQSVFPGVRYPIIQAPMAGTATPELAAEVSNAGGIGSLGIGSSTISQARALIEQTRALTDQPFNINVFCHQPAIRDARREADWLNHLAPLFDEIGAEVPTQIHEIYKSFLDDDGMLQMLLETRPAIVSFHFGIPKPEHIASMREAGITTLATATNLSDAQAIEAAGVDAIVAQGIEAGGHRGMFDTEAVDQRLPTSVLVRELVANISLPVIAAGGIMDGQGIRAILDLGAVAAQLGTAFVLCPESAANTSYRDALKSDQATATKLTPVLSGRPARGIVNRYIEHCESPGAPVPPAYPITYDATKQLVAAAAISSTGASEFAPHWAGQGAPLAREMPASTLMATLVRELIATGSE